MARKLYDDATFDEVAKDKLSLCNPYAHLTGDGELRALKAVRALPDVLNEVKISRFVMQNPYAYENGEEGFDAISNRKNKYSRQDIEKRVSIIHKLIWRNRYKIWAEVPTNPVEMLDPTKAIEFLGYKVSVEPSLGEIRLGSHVINTAGIVDNEAREIRLSRNYKPEVRRFTAAHELGHILMHEQSGLHKDRPVDGIIKNKDEVEYQADVFASIFLMPRNLVAERFRKLFLSDSLELNNVTPLEFSNKQQLPLKGKQTLRDFSRSIASCESYNGKHFQSLSSQFKVSVEAMAIRLEELNLVVMG